MLFSIDAATGKVVWDDIYIDSQTTLDNFRANFPQLDIHKINPPAYQPHMGVWIGYELPVKVYQHQQYTLWISFVNYRITGVAVISQDFTNINSRVEADPFWKEKLKWVEVIYENLRSQIGVPTQIKSASEMEKSTLINKPDYFIDQLKLWHYEFSWGTIWCLHRNNKLQLEDGIHIAYDTFHQLKNWDELYEECNRLIEIEENYNNGRV